MASFPYLLTDSKHHKPTSSSSPSTSSSFSIDTLLSSPLSLSSNFPTQIQDSFSSFSWPIHTTYPFVSMLCSPLLPQFMPPYQHFTSRRKRRHRTIFSEEQLSILENTFLSTHYPDVATREKLAIQCALKEERVEVWFKNRRAKDRKQKRDENCQLSSKLSDDSECDESDEDVKRVKKIKKEKESSSPEVKSISSSSSSS